jgi:ubiquinone/menaquinone biosynthesis C-methylase UbiE
VGKLKSDSPDPMTRESGQERERHQWDGVALGWKKWWPVIEAGARHVSERMVALAAIAPGHRVLDLATGIGEPALLAAARVGPEGRVVATDLSSGMLRIARERAMGAGLTNVALLEADTARLPFPDACYDAVLCRWGVASLPDAVEALRSVRRLLVPGGSLVAAVWADGPRGRPLAGLVASVSREMFPVPSSPPATADVPRPESSTLAADLSRAGYRDVRSEEMQLTLEFPSPEDGVQYLCDVSPDVTALLAGKSVEQTTVFRRRLADGLHEYTMADGSVRVTNVTICTVGRGGQR